MGTLTLNNSNGGSIILEPSVNGSDTILDSINSTLAHSGSAYYTQAQILQYAATNGSGGSAFAFDSSGNLYWAITNSYNGSTWTLTSYVYKITPNGTLTTFASATTYGCLSTDLAFDSSGNLYWAVGNHYTGTGGTYNTTSYVYKITPAGSLTTFASAGTNSARDTSLAFDNSGNLFWTISNHYNGSTYELTSYVYKITPGGSLTTFVGQPTIGAYGTDLVFDSNGNLYWAISNYTTGSTYNLTSYVYKITSAGSLSIFASQLTDGMLKTSLAFDSSGNLYWATPNYYTGSTYDLTSYIYKITPNGTKTTFASQATRAAYGTDVIVDSEDNIYWAIANYEGTSYIYKINSQGNISTIASQTTQGASNTNLIFDNNGNLYWDIVQYHTGASYNSTGYVYKLSRHEIGE